MDHGTNKPMHFADPSSAPHAPELSALLMQVNDTEELLSALSAPELNISHLFPCHAAAVRLGDDIRLLQNAAGASVRALTDQLQQLPRQAHYQQTWTGENGQAEHVLAVPFDRQANGWLVWFALAHSAPPFGDTELQLAQHLRAELLETALARANAMCLAQRRLISTLGHGLCNPLQSISMSAALLKPHDTRSTELRSHICLASESMEHQINRMLEVNRLNGGESLRINPVQGNLSNLIASEVSRLRNTLPKLQIQTDIDGDVLCQMDSERLSQALRHLLNNASQYAIADTPVHIQLKRDPTTEAIRLAVNNHAAELNRARVNSLFSAIKAGEDENRRGNRLGIGLYVTAHIIRAHGGQIRAQQANGTIEFQIVLPGDGSASQAASF